MHRFAFCAGGVFFCSVVWGAPPVAAAPAAEDCIRVDPVSVAVGHTGNDWKVVQGAASILDYGADAPGAQRAVDVIQHYHFTRQCFVGRTIMMYWKNGDAVPPGNMPGQDCIVIDPANVVAQYSTARWKVVDGNNWLLDYGQDRNAAEEAASVIRTYSLNRECFVDRQNVAMQYWLAE